MIPLALASQRLQEIIPELMQLHSFYSIWYTGNMRNKNDQMPPYSTKSH
jgi:hypothetical protein